MVNGNLAYKKEVVTKPIRPVMKQTKTVKDNKDMIRRRVTFLRILYTAAIAVSAAFMVSKFVIANETAGEIKSLSQDLAEARAYTSQKVFEMERSVDLDEVEKIATTRLGMQRPESYQIVYVNVDKDDVSEVTAGDVEGAKNELMDTLDSIKKNILEFFSIE